ncbi:hypothetical protein [Larkinella harenae]
MTYEPLPPPGRKRLTDHSVHLTWHSLSFEQTCWLIKQTYFLKKAVFADFYFYEQLCSIHVKIGPSDTTTLIFPQSRVGTITEEIINLVILELTTSPEELDS